MSDNTTLNAGTGGDLVRTIAKTANAPVKTQMMVIDVGGGADSSPEAPLVVGQAAKAASLSFVPASDLSSIEPAGAAITGASMPAGGLGLTGWLSAIWSKLSGSIAVTGTFWQATQPVSAASLPLPTGAAMEAGGNLAAVASAAGTIADAAYSGSGSASLVAALKGVYARLAPGQATKAASLSVTMASDQGAIPVSGSFSATLSGFQPGSAYATPLSVSTTSSRVALPAGTVVVVYNTGSAAAYVQLGGSGVAATTSNDVVPAGGWMAFTVGSNGYLAAITASGTTSLNLSGGSGLATGAGGGGGGSGGTVSVSSLPGSTGHDYSTGAPTLPNVGANFGASGVYASYYLTAVVAAGSRNNVDIENVSGAQIVVVRDDGTAAAGSAPANASVFALAGGLSAGAQGGSWSSSTFKGRLQIYSPLTTAITFTAALTAATSGTLTSAWTGPTGAFYVTFSTGAAQLASFTNGSTAVSWSTAVTATTAATAATAQIAAFTD